jgi:precorrin-6A/cobalt-precorrin-6A reductase
MAARETHILLIGGTADTAPIARRLAQSGYRVLVSRATDTPLELGGCENVTSRSGPLDDAALADLIARRAIDAIVDAAHPYAAAIHQRAERVARARGVPCLSFTRPPVVAADEPGVEFAGDHAEAARLAFAHGRPVLLTTGSTHLEPYAAEASRLGLPLVVRVLGNRQSLECCRRAGIAEQCVLTGRGPFPTEENRRQIRAFGIGVLVTKDSGRAGGTREKLDAARGEECRVVVLRRPATSMSQVYTEIDALLLALGRVFNR